MAPGLFTAIGAGLQIVLLFATHLFSHDRIYGVAVKKATEEGLNAVKKMDAVQYTNSLLRLRRLREKWRH